jgi:hypothetical protein
VKRKIPFYPYIVWNNKIRIAIGENTGEEKIPLGLSGSLGFLGFYVCYTTNRFLRGGI